MLCRCAEADIFSRRDTGLPIKSDLMLFAEQHDFSYKTNDHSSLLTWFPLGHHKNNMHKSDECDIE